MEGHFKIQERQLADGRKRQDAVCQWPECGSVLQGASSAGTGHLERHARTHQAKQDQARRREQGQLPFGPDGQVRNFHYDPNVSREGLCRMIAAHDLPLGFGEYPAVVDWVRDCHNPRYQPVSRQTTFRDMKKLAKKMREEIKDEFSTCTFSVSITSDIWSGKAKQDYLSVVAHYVNNDNWELKKRIIGFELIDVSHTGHAIAERILEVVQEFNLTDKIFAITLDNASSNTTAMEELTPILSVYAQSYLLHQRCACHILNLIAKCALKYMKPCIEKIRSAIAFLNYSNPRLASYKRWCGAAEASAHVYHLDVPTRWNSTYIMIRDLIPDKDQFTTFVNSNSQGQIFITDDDWQVAAVLLNFLETLHDATNVLSGVYYPTSPLMVHQLVNIASHLKDNENHELLRHAIIKMKAKYLKYWKNIPILYAFAFILDPRAKVQGLGFALSHLNWALEIDFATYQFEVKEKLADLFKKYEVKYAGVRQRRPPPPAPAGKKKTNFSRIFGAGSSSSSSTTHQQPAGGGELAAYLNSEMVNHEDTPEDEFNILQWWHDHKLTYPVLSILARDVLTVPVSTTSSEGAFSLSKRVIEERRASLHPDTVKTLMTVKDGELARRRAQHAPEDPELLATMQNLYLHGDEDE